MPQSAVRNGAHRVADTVYEKITGVRGAFATRIAYVSVDGQPPNQRYQLLIADADGENARIAMQSSQPMMSPAWSPDGEWLAYVSFENRVAAVFVQRVRTGERRQVSARAGVNGAPSVLARRQASWRSPCPAAPATSTSTCSTWPRRG